MVNYIKLDTFKMFQMAIHFSSKLNHKLSTVSNLDGWPSTSIHQSKLDSWKMKKIVKRHCKWRDWISLVWLYFNLCTERWRCLFKIAFTGNWWSRANWSFESKSNHFQRSCSRKLAQGTRFVKLTTLCSPYRV